MNKFQNLGVKFELSNEDYINPQFTKGRCKVAYHGKNRNYSQISKDVFEKALPSIKNIPVVGYYDEEEGVFTAHIGKVEMKDGEFKIHYPVPVGVVPENCNPTFEKVLEEDGTINEYLCCDVLLWTGRWGYILDAYENGNGFRQSMEIEINSWSSIDEEYMRIDDLTFSSLCLLGTAEPCFESSDVQLFNLNKDKFKQEFSLLLNEIKNIKQEGDIVEDNKQQENGEKTIETPIVEENDSSKEDGDATEQIENTNDGENAEFQLSHEDVQEKLRVVVANQFNAEKWDVWVSSSYVYETYFIYELWTESNGYKYYKANYSIDVEENVIVDFNEVEEVQHKQIWVSVNEYENLENKYSEVKKKLENTKKEKENFEAELGKKDIKIQELEKSKFELTSFKENLEEKQRTNEINSVITKFSQLTDLEKSELKEEALKGKISIDELEVKLFALIGRKNFSVSNKDNVEKPIAYNLKFNIKEEGVFTKYKSLEDLI